MFPFSLKIQLENLTSLTRGGINALQLSVKFDCYMKLACQWLRLFREGLIVPILRHFGNLNFTYYGNFGSRILCSSCRSIKKILVWFWKQALTSLVFFWIKKNSIFATFKYFNENNHQVCLCVVWCYFFNAQKLYSWSVGYN